MNATITPKEIVAGFAVAGVTLCLGIYFSMKAGGDTGTLLIRVFYVLAALIVLKFTFAWGCMRGFPTRRQDGSIAVSHLMRNLVMSAIVWCALLFLFAPVVMLTFKLTR